MDITSELFKLQDADYKRFHAALIPNIDPKNIIGIRVPVLRNFAKKIRSSSECSEFLKELPHRYYEENNLHAFIIEQIKDADEAFEAVDAFLPFIDNWATCDCLRPKAFAGDKELLLKYVLNWLNSDKTYTVRFAIEMLMTHFLDDSFDIKYPTLVASIKTDDYYINMMSAWYFATALAKQWQAVIPFIEKRVLSDFVHKKTIQKAKESKRISTEQKEYLSTIRS